jgi:hypothetical protein
MAKKKEEVRDLALKETTALDIPMPEGGWDDGEIEAKDLLIPMICVAQGSSDLAKRGEARPGDIYETVNKEILGDAKTSVNFIPIKYYKTWIHSEVIGGRPQFRSVEPYTPTNMEKYKYEETKQNGTLWRHYEVLNFYVILEKDLLEGRAFPHLLSFRSSNKRKGRPLLNHMATARRYNPPMPLCSMVFSINTVLATKGKDTWSVFDVKKVRATTKDEIMECLGWLENMKTQNHKVDDSSIVEEMQADEETMDAVAEKKAQNIVVENSRY